MSRTCYLGQLDCMSIWCFYHKKLYKRYVACLVFSNGWKLYELVCLRPFYRSAGFTHYATRRQISVHSRDTSFRTGRLVYNTPSQHATSRLRVPHHTGVLALGFSTEGLWRNHRTFRTAKSPTVTATSDVNAENIPVSEHSYCWELFNELTSLRRECQESR